MRMTKAQQHEIDGLTADQRSTYHEARAVGACHDDAMDAVACTTSRTDRLAESIIRGEVTFENALRGLLT